MENFDRFRLVIKKKKNSPKRQTEPTIAGLRWGQAGSYWRLKKAVCILAIALHCRSEETTCQFTNLTTSGGGGTHPLPVPPHISPGVCVAALLASVFGFGSCPLPLPMAVASTNSPSSFIQSFFVLHTSSRWITILLCSFLLSLLPTTAFASSGVRVEGLESRSRNLYPEILRDEAVARLRQLGEVSDADGYLERTFLSPASVKAGNLIRQWMEEAGLRTWIDYLGNVHGRVEGRNASAAALLIGSHLDTVVDAGIFDGPLGIITALAALKVLNINGKLQAVMRPIEVIAFSDEEGVRFQSTFLGSAAVAGILPASALHISDKSGVTVEDVLKDNSLDITDENLLKVKYEPRSVWGYVEVHIEQGPVLEQTGFPLAVVKGIAGQTRLKVTVRGSQGHAGTVPMSMRQDPMPAAAEVILLLESLCKCPEDFLSYDGHCKSISLESLSSSLVCTVGEIETWPGASNVIPGQVTFTIDLRTIDDMGREAIVYEFSNRMYQICDRRSVSCTIERKHDANAVLCDSELSMRLKSAAYSAVTRLTDEIQDEIPVLMSGAGHDAMAMSHLTKVGMLFVRCRGGVSHSPEENVLDEDVWTSGLAVLSFIETQL